MKRNILFYVALLFCIICNLQSYAQTNVTVKGTVVDRESRQGFPGVTISLTSTGKAIGATNGSGQFSVTVPVGSTLAFDYVGFTRQTSKISASTTSINIVLGEDKKDLKEVVIIAYQKRTKETQAGSVVTIDAKDIQDVPVSSAEQLLQGKVPGLNVQVNTGAPGFRGSVQVRGLSSLSISGSGNDSFLQPTSPLYIIDGVPLDADAAAEYGFQTQGPGVSPLSLIPPEDIASIQVLKDAQATSLYGSRGAYGVIIITTKRGNSKVPRVRYTANSFVKTPPKLRETLGGNSERGLKLGQIITNAININDIRRIGDTPFLSDSLNAYWNNSTDWQSIFFQTTYNQTHNLALDGGNEKFNYKANLGYYGENGVIKNTGFDRYNLSLNTEFKPNEKFRFFGAVKAALGKQNKGNGVGLLQSGVASNGQASTLLPAPSFYQATGGVLSALQTENDNSTKNITANIDARYQFIEGLAFQTAFSYDYTSSAESTFTPAAANGQFAQLYDFTGRKFQLYNRNGITYSKTFGEKHNLFVNTFNEIYKRGAQNGVSLQKRTPNDQLQGPLGFDGYNSRGGGVLGNYQNATIASFAGGLSYNYDTKYVLEASYRLDGTSQSGLENPYSKNPSIGLRWNFNKEKWFEDLKWLEYGSLRATWGQNIVPTGSLESIYGRYNLNGSFNNTPTIGIDYNQVPNPNLKPTTTSQYNFGFDLGLFKDKLSLTFDAYYKKVDNLLFDRNLANITGFNILSSNDLGIANYGYELNIITRIINKADFGVDLSVNGAINRDILLKLPTEYNGQFIRFDNSQYSQHNIFRVGRNTLSNFLRINQGVYSTDADVPVDPMTGRRYQTNGQFFLAGDPILKDVNGDYNLDGRDYEVSGNAQPLITGGLSSNIRYKNWGLNLYGSFTADRTILNNALADRIGIVSDPYSLRAYVPLNDLNIWKAPGDVAKYPYPYDYRRFSQINPVRPDQTLWAESGSYLKLSNLTLSYRFPKEMVGRFGLNSLRIYGSTDNLITFSKYSGPNPENVTTLGRDISTGYPVPRTYNIGINIELNTGN